jgi:hypothetical protein
MNKKFYLIAGLTFIISTIITFSIINYYNSKLNSAIKEVIENNSSGISQHGKIDCSITKDTCILNNLELKDNNLKIKKTTIIGLKDIEIMLNKSNKNEVKKLNLTLKFQDIKNLDKSKNSYKNLLLSYIEDKDKKIKNKIKNTKLNLEFDLKMKQVKEKTNISIKSSTELKNLIGFNINTEAFFITSINELLKELHSSKNSLYEKIGISKLDISLINNGGLIDLFYLSYLSDIKINPVLANKQYFNINKDTALSREEFNKNLIKMINRKETIENLNKLARQFTINIDTSNVIKFLKKENKDLTLSIISKEDILLVKALYLVQSGNYSNLLNNYIIKLK